jgi:hypothetical protein
MSSRLVTASLGLAVLIGVGQPRPSHAQELCDAPPYHAADFLAGSFRLVDDKNTLIAEEKVVSEMKGCVLHEYFKSAQGQPAESFSFYDPAEKSWFQYAVGLHLIFRLKGTADKGALRLEGSSTHLHAGDSRPMRATWIAQPDGTIAEQLIEKDLKTGAWVTIFSGELIRQ